MPSLLCELHFHPFNKGVNDAYGSHKGFKLDGVGILRELMSAELSWNQIKVTFKAKTTIPDLICHSGTYTCCHLLQCFQ